MEISCPNCDGTFGINKNDFNKSDEHIIVCPFCEEEFELMKIGCECEFCKSHNTWSYNDDKGFFEVFCFGCEDYFTKLK